MEISESLAAKFVEELRATHKPKLELDFKLTHLANQLKSDRAKVFLQQGVLRRLGTIHQCANNIYSTFPPARQDLLTKEELNSVTIYVQAFLVNVYGILDNIAWVCALENGFQEPDKNRNQIGLFRKEMKAYLPEKLRSYVRMKETKNWFDTYAKDYRDSTTHRIPPYLPPYRASFEDEKAINELEDQAQRALIEEWDVDLHETLIKKQKGFYKITGIVAISLSGGFKERPPFHMHPQIICDILTIQELLNYLVDGMNEAHQFTPAYVPNLDDIN